jgi:hypothetical protein
VSSELTLADLAAEHRLVANCACGHRCAVAPAAVLEGRPEARGWTVAELAARLRCTRCRRPLLARGEADDPRIVRRRLALERPTRRPITFQDGMALPARGR